MDALLAFAIPAIATWMLGKVMDELFERWTKRRPMEARRWQRAKRRFHFWAAALFSAWCAAVGTLLLAGALTTGYAAPGEVAAIVAFFAASAAMANVARIRRRRMR